MDPPLAPSKWGVKCVILMKASLRLIIGCLGRPFTCLPFCLPTLLGGEYQVLQHFLLPSIEGDCELAQQSGSLSDGGRAGGGSAYLSASSASSADEELPRAAGLLWILNFELWILYSFTDFRPLRTWVDIISRLTLQRYNMGGAVCKFFSLSFQN